MDNEDDSIQIYVENNTNKSQEQTISKIEQRKQQIKQKKKNQKFHIKNTQDTFANKINIRKDKTNLIHKKNRNAIVQKVSQQSNPIIKSSTNKQQSTQYKQYDDNEFDVEGQNEEIDDQYKKQSQITPNNPRFQQRGNSKVKYNQNAKFLSNSNKEKSRFIVESEENKISESLFINQDEIKKKRQEQQIQLSAQNESTEQKNSQVKKKVSVNQPEIPIQSDIDDKKLFSSNKFEDLSINPRILSALHANNYQIMTNIQKDSFPAIKSGDNCVIKSETGSGKTLAYMVPIINQLCELEQKIQRNDGSHLIIICPVRELCIQCVEMAQKLVHRCIWIIVGGLYGGEDIQKEKARIRKGLNIICATPGRLLYHMKNTQSLKYNKLTYLVFEESDRILDMGFKKDLEEIISIMKNNLEFNNVQKILISSNYTQRIESLYLQMSSKQITYIGFSQSSQSQKQIQSNKTQQENNEDLEMQDENVTQLDQNKQEKNEFIQTDDKIVIPSSLKQMYVVLDEENRIPFLCAFISLLKTNKIIIFVATCDEVEYFDYLFKNLKYKNQDGQFTDNLIIPHSIFKLHGSINQKERSKTYFSFKKAQSSAILISTDVASRGLDFDDVSHTILFDIPSSVVEYCNRIGRTARIDMPGASLLVLNNIEHAFIEYLKQENLKLEQFDEWTAITKFQEILRKGQNVGMEPYIYISGLVKYVFKDQTNQLLARRAYVSSLRAYSRLSYNSIFKLKQLNLKNYAKTFGLERVKSQGDTSKKQYQNDLRVTHKEKFKQEDLLKKKFSHKKPRNIVNDSAIYKMEFM